MAVDFRDPSVDRATPQRLVELQALAAHLRSARADHPDVEIVRVDPVTGNAAAVKPAAAGARARATDVARCALAYVELAGPLFGFTGDTPNEFVAFEAVTTSSCAQAVQVRPRIHGIEIFDAMLTVRFSPERVIEEIVGRGVATSDTGSTTPQIDAKAAVDAAARQLADFTAASAGALDPFGQPVTLPQIDPTQLDLQITATDAGTPERPTQVSDGPMLMTPITARLIWFPLRQGLRLAWEVRLAMAADGRPFRSSVDAFDGTVLYFQPG